MRKSARATLAAAIYTIEQVFAEVPNISTPAMASNKTKLSEAEQALQLLEVVADFTKQAPDYIINRKRTRRRPVADARAMYCACLLMGGWKDWEIAQLLSMEASSIRHAIARHRKFYGTDERYTNTAKKMKEYATIIFLNPKHK